MMYELRDTGIMDLDADKILFLHRESNNGNSIIGEERNVVQLSVIKNRNGNVGAIELKYFYYECLKDGIYDIGNIKQ